MAAPALQDTAATAQTVSEAPGGVGLREPPAHTASDSRLGDEEAGRFASAAADAPLGVAAVERDREDRPSPGEKKAAVEPAGADSAASSRGETSPPADPQSDVWPRIVTVAPGANLIRLVAKVYGRNDPALLQLVQSANPHLVDRDRILVGTQLSFPAVPPPPALAAAGGDAQQ